MFNNFNNNNYNNKIETIKIEFKLSQIFKIILFRGDQVKLITMINLTSNITILKQTVIIHKIN